MKYGRERSIMAETFTLYKLIILYMLKRVDFPTLGRPTIPAFNAIVLSCFLVIVQLIGCKDSANRKQMQIYLQCEEA